MYRQRREGKGEQEQCVREREEEAHSSSSSRATKDDDDDDDAVRPVPVFAREARPSVTAAAAAEVVRNTHTEQCSQSFE